MPPCVQLPDMLPAAALLSSSSRHPALARSLHDLGPIKALHAGVAGSTTVQLDGDLLQLLLDLPPHLQLQLLQRQAQALAEVPDQHRQQGGNVRPATACPTVHQLLGRHGEGSWVDADGLPGTGGTPSGAEVAAGRAGAREMHVAGVPVSQLLLSPSHTQAQACLAGVVLPALQQFLDGNV